MLLSSGLLQVALSAALSSGWIYIFINIRYFSMNTFDYGNRASVSETFKIFYQRIPSPVIDILAEVSVSVETTDTFHFLKCNIYFFP